MALINANPNAEVKSFVAVKPGPYQMRITEVIDRNPDKNDLQIKVEHVQPASELLGVDNLPLKGMPSSVFDYIMLAADKQWKLRQLTEACGLVWGDYDPVVELPQKEITVVLKTEIYEGEVKNKVARYVVAK